VTLLDLNQIEKIKRKRENNSRIKEKRKEAQPRSPLGLSAQ
jgi:hypothetical protein